MSNNLERAVGDLQANKHYESDRPFTCAECGHLMFFRPSNPPVCPGCRSNRWILGEDRKLFDWKAGLAVVRKPEQIANVIRRRMNDLLSEPDDPITMALMSVQRAGFESASEIQECGHSLGDRRDNDRTCNACLKEKELLNAVEIQRDRANMLQAEIDGFTEKLAESETRNSELNTEIDKMAAELAVAKSKISAFEAVDIEGLRGALVAAETKIELMKVEADVAQRQLAAMDAFAMRAAKAENALAEFQGSWADALKQQALLRKERDELEKRVAELLERSDAVVSKCAQLQHEVNDAVATTLEMKQVHEANVRATAAQVIGLENEKKLLADDMNVLKHEYDALQRRYDEAWFNKDKVVELDALNAKLVHDLEVERASCEKAQREIEELISAHASRMMELDALNSRLTSELEDAKSDTAKIRREAEGEAIAHALQIEQLQKELASSRSQLSGIIEKLRGLDVGGAS